MQQRVQIIKSKFFRWFEDITICKKLGTYNGHGGSNIKMSSPYSDEDFSELDLVGFIYNEKYGGFCYSEKFIERLNEKRVEKGLEKIVGSPYELSFKKSLRFDPISIEVFNELGREESSGSASTLNIKWFPKVFIKFVRIDEYDGEETLFMDTNKIYSHMLENFFEREDSNENSFQDLKSKYFETKRLLSKYFDYRKKRV